MGPLTGDASVYGKAVVNGATLYLKQVNEKGGVNGKQLEAVTMDEQGDETQAVTCFTKMVDQGITALVGDVTTAPTLAVAAESAEYNVPMVTASATAEAVTYDAETDTVNENVFRACFTDPFQGVKMADYAYEKLGYTKAAVIFLKGKDYNEGLAENFVKEFEAKGGDQWSIRKATPRATWTLRPSSPASWARAPRWCSAPTTIRTWARSWPRLRASA